MKFFTYIVLALVAVCHAEVSHPDAPIPDPNPQNVVCKTRNAYYSNEGSCDSYIECKDFVPQEQLCPDGLHFNPNTNWPAYPCGYPSDVPCVGRGSTQAAQATAECPHQYGYFQSLVASENCGQYRMCAAGQAFEMVCPTGLAFNPDTSRCDWPDLVPSCKPDEFFGFTCPPAPRDVYGRPIDSVINYKYEGNCYYFFACELGRARLLSCDKGLAFDDASGRCIDDNLVQCAYQKK